MLQIVEQLLSPFSFYTVKKNKNGRFNKFYGNDGKMFTYRSYGLYFFKYKGKVRILFRKPENLEDALNNTVLVCDKTGFGMKKEMRGQKSSYHCSYMLEHMHIDHVSKHHGVTVNGTIMYRSEQDIDTGVEEEEKNLHCPTYYYLPNDLKNKYPFVKYMWYNLDGTPSEETKKSEYYIHKKNMLDAYLDGMRLRTNNMSKRRRIDKKAITAVEKAEQSGDWSNIDPADTFKIKNVSTRRKMLSHFSVNEIIKSQNPETVDTAEINGSKYKLIKFEQTISEDVPFTHCYYLEMLNVSTGETHLEGVAPYIKNNDIMWGQFAKRNTLYAETVEAALAWRDRDNNVENEEGNFRSSGELNEKYDSIDKSYNQPVAIS